MEFFREIDLMKNTKKTILENLTSTNRKRKGEATVYFSQLATNGNLI